MNQSKSQPNGDLSSPVADSNVSAANQANYGTIKSNEVGRRIVAFSGPWPCLASKKEAIKAAFVTIKTNETNFNTKKITQTNFVPIVLI